jgi:hypothetical protein
MAYLWRALGAHVQAMASVCGLTPLTNHCEERHQYLDDLEGKTKTRERMHLSCTNTHSLQRWLELEPPMNQPGVLLLALRRQNAVAAAPRAMIAPTGATEHLHVHRMAAVLSVDETDAVGGGQDLQKAMFSASLRL